MGEPRRCEQPRFLNLLLFFPSRVFVCRQLRLGCHAPSPGFPQADIRIVTGAQLSLSAKPPVLLPPVFGAVWMHHQSHRRAPRRRVDVGGREMVRLQESNN